MTTEGRRPREPRILDRGTDPAKRRRSSAWGDSPSKSDLTDYADTAWMDKYNEQAKAGNTIAALGWLIGGPTRDSFMQKYRVENGKLVPRMTDQQEKIIQRFETAQTIVNFAKRIFGDEKKKKVPMRERVKMARKLIRDAREDRRDRINHGGGLINRAVSSFFPDRFAERLDIHAAIRPYATDEDRRILAGEPPVSDQDTQPIPVVPPLPDENKGVPAPEPEPEPTAPGPEPAVNTSGHHVPDGESQTNSNGSNTTQPPLPDWVVTAWAEHLENEHRAAESAANESAYADPVDLYKNSTIDHTGHVVIDMPPEPNSNPDLKPSDVDLPPEPEVGATTRATIGEQEAEHGEDTTTGQKKTKTK